MRLRGGQSEARNPARDVLEGRLKSTWRLLQAVDRRLRSPSARIGPLMVRPFYRWTEPAQNRRPRNGAAARPAKPGRTPAGPGPELRTSSTSPPPGP
ncbi:hypothetical protein ACRAWD_28965 [Caulobacter segnis]